MQNFKGDQTELKMQAVVDPLLDLTDAALAEFYEGAYDCNAFLLMLYDEERMPFSERIPRAAFVDFIKQALTNFPFTGSFDSYLFVLSSIFGELADIQFTIPDPGKLQIDIEAVANSEFEFIGRQFVDGAYEFFNITDDEGSLLIFRGIPGIESEYELNLLFAEVMPVGIVPTITLSFISRYDFVAEESSVLYNVVTDDLDQIIFWEIGA